jgi:hypothetical protein
MTENIHDEKYNVKPKNKNEWVGIITDFGTFFTLIHDL